MYTLIVENMAGNALELTHNCNFSVLNVDGITPAAANINTATVGNSDGERFTSSRVGTRNVVITLKMEGDAEQSRISLYSFFRPKQWCRLYFRNGARNVHIDGYTESFDGDLFELGETMQISVLCPQPYFIANDGNSASIARIVSLFEFPFSIATGGIPFSEINDSSVANVINHGDVDIGVIVEMNAVGGNVVNPIVYEANTRQSFPLPDTTLLDGDTITINTNRGEKKIQLLRNGVVSNIISQLTAPVDWFQIPPGSSTFTFACDSGEEFLQIDFSASEKYQGV